MKNLVGQGTLAMLAIAGAATAAMGQELRPATGFWVRAGGVIRSGYGVSFSDTSAPLPTGAGNYADGFVRASISTNSPYTWNWGYSDPAQISGNTLQLSRFDSAPRVGAVDGGSQSAFGGELRAGFEALRFELFERDVRFGLEAGYSFSSLSASGSGSVTRSSSYSTATYSLIGPGGQPIIPADGPYSGTFNGPGPVIPLAPISQGTLVGQGTSVVELGLDADLHTLKFGPYFELPLSSRWVVGMSFGYCTVLPDAEFRISESTRFPGTAIPGSSLERTVRRSDWQPGGYAEIRLNFELTRSIGLYLAGEFQHNENLQFGGFGREAQVKMGAIYGASAGVRLAF